MTNATAPQTVVLMPPLVTENHQPSLMGPFLDTFHRFIVGPSCIMEHKTLPFAFYGQNGKMSPVLMQFAERVRRSALSCQACHEYFIRPEKNVMFADVRSNWEKLAKLCRQ